MGDNTRKNFKEKEKLKELNDKENKIRFGFKPRPKKRRSKMEELKWFYWVESDEGPNFFEKPEEFLTFLQNNDPCESGAKHMTQSEFDALPTPE